MRDHNFGLTDLKPPADFAADWAVDVDLFDEPNEISLLPGFILTAFLAALQIAVGVGIGWVIWGAA
jgi:hypothetical protein